MSEGLDWDKLPRLLGTITLARLLVIFIVCLVLIVSAEINYSALSDIFIFLGPVLIALTPYLIVNRADRYGYFKQVLYETIEDYYLISHIQESKWISRIMVIVLLLPFIGGWIDRDTVHGGFALWISMLISFLYLILAPILDFRLYLKARKLVAKT